MSVKIFFRTACSAIITLLLLSGCNNDFDNGLVASLHLRDKFSQVSNNFVPGDDITMSLSIKNDSTSETTLRFPDNYLYDFVIKDDSANEVWRWSTTGLSRVDGATPLRLGPSDIQTINYTWDQIITTETTTIEDGVATVATQNDPIAAGDYTLEAYFIGYDSTKAKMTFTILP